MDVPHLNGVRFLPMSISSLRDTKKRKARAKAENCLTPCVKVGASGRLKPFSEGLEMSISLCLSRYCLACMLVLVLFVACLPPAVRADGGAPNLAYVAGTEGVTVIDVAQQKITRVFALAGDPHTILLSLDGRFLYVTQPDLGQVAVLVAGTGHVLCTARIPGQPTLLAFDPQANTFFAAGNRAASVSEIDPLSCRVLQTLKTRGPVYGLAVAIVNAVPGGTIRNQIWVADATSLTAFESGTGQQLAQIPLVAGPQYLCIPPGRMAYVVTRRGTIEAIDLSSHRAVTVLAGGKFGPMDYDALTGEVDVPDQQHQWLEVLTPLSPGATVPSHEPSYLYRLGGSPQSVAVTSDGQLGFVALAGGDVVMLDIPGEQVVRTIHVGGTPHFIITGLYPPAVAGTTSAPVPVANIVITIVVSFLALEAVLVPLWFLWRRNKKRGL
jgi:DNA-binding beta-propeller fold protein YncE